MKFDLHCHTKEGSLDSKVSVKEYVQKFRELGYDGFMITDHNSYRGCIMWDIIKNREEYRDFTVLKGIEYDTKDAGHILVVMPDDLYLPLLKLRGLKCSTLIRIVHDFGGILGLAHPYGAASSSAMGFKLMDETLISQLDFIEAFNTCESASSNERAEILASRYGLPAFAGSDSHVQDYIGMACTEIDGDIRCNNDLIAAVKAGVMIKAGGTEREITRKGKSKEHWLGVLAYRLYNRGIGKIVFPYRKYRLNMLLEQI